MFPFGCAQPGRAKRLGGSTLRCARVVSPCLRMGTSAPARRQKLGHRLSRCEGSASGWPAVGHEARLQGQPSQQRTGQENLATRGRVTTATPAELDFKPPTMGGVEGCADTMSARSSVSMDSGHAGFNARARQRRQRHPQHWPGRGLCVSCCSTAFSSGDERLAWAAPVSPRSTCVASRDSSTGRGERAAMSAAPANMTANAPPPRRATVSSGRGPRGNAAAKYRSTVSPAAWTWVSLIHLKSSRSSRGRVPSAGRSPGADHRRVEVLGGWAAPSDRHGEVPAALQ